MIIKKMLNDKYWGKRCERCNRTYGSHSSFNAKCPRRKGKGSRFISATFKLKKKMNKSK